MANPQQFYATLERVTGLERIEAEIKRIGSLQVGDTIFMNSGVLKMQGIPMDFGSLAVGGFEMDGKLVTGPRINVANLVMDTRNAPEHWHVHPGHELTIVREGSYFDEQGPRYQKGDWVWYNTFSSHRPLVGARAGETAQGSNTADLSYITFNGLLRLDHMKSFDLSVLLGKAVKAGIKNAPDALDYLLRSTVADPNERRKLMDEALK